MVGSSASANGCKYRAYSKSKNDGALAASCLDFYHKPAKTVRRKLALFYKGANHIRFKLGKREIVSCLLAGRRPDYSLPSFQGKSTSTTRFNLNPYPTCQSRPVSSDAGLQSRAG
jgi:hypothetical protein